MKKALIIAMVLIVPFMFMSRSFAQEEMPGAYKPFLKFGRGVINIGSCPYEIPKQMYLLSRNGDTFWGTTAQGLAGVFVGTGWMFYRLAAGVYDVFTSPFPGCEESIIDPEYAF